MSSLGWEERAFEVLSSARALCCLVAFSQLLGGKSSMQDMLCSVSGQSRRRRREDTNDKKRGGRLLRERSVGVRATRSCWRRGRERETLSRRDDGSCGGWAGEEADVTGQKRAQEACTCINGLGAQDLCPALCNGNTELDGKHDLFETRL